MSCSAMYVDFGTSSISDLQDQILNRLAGGFAKDFFEAIDFLKTFAEPPQPSVASVKPPGPAPSVAGSMDLSVLADDDDVARKKRRVVRDPTLTEEEDFDELNVNQCVACNGTACS